MVEVLNVCKESAAVKEAEDEMNLYDSMSCKIVSNSEHMTDTLLQSTCETR